MVEYPPGAFVGELLDRFHMAKIVEEESPDWYETTKAAASIYMEYMAMFPGKTARAHLKKQGLDEHWLSWLEKGAKYLEDGEWDPGPVIWKPGMAWVPLYNEKYDKGYVALLKVGLEGEGYSDPLVKEAFSSAHKALNQVLLGRRATGVLEPLGRWSIRVIRLGLDRKDLANDGLTGDSLALPTALAMVSLLKNAPVPKDMVATGALTISDNSVIVTKVGKIRRKWEGALREVPGLRLFLAPPKSPKITSKIIRYPRDFDEAACLVFGSDAFLGMVHGLDYERVAAEIRRTLAEGDHARVISLATDYIAAMGHIPQLKKELWNLSVDRAAALAHQGRTMDALRQFQSADRLGETLLTKGTIGPSDLLAFRNRMSNTLIPHFAFEVAEQKLKKILSEVTPYDKESEGKIRGTLGQLLLYIGRFDEAETELIAALKTVPKKERARNYCYLGNLKARRGQYKEAKPMYEKSLKANREAAIPEPERLNNERFTRAGYAGLGIRSGNWCLAVEQAQMGLKAAAKREAIGFGASINPEIFYYLALHRSAVFGDVESEKASSIRDELYGKVKTIGKDSHILLLLSRLAGMDLAEAWAERGQGDVSEAVDAIRDYLSILKTHTGASRWFRDEIRVFKRFVGSPDRNRIMFIDAARSVRNRMPYL